MCWLSGSATRAMSTFVNAMWPGCTSAKARVVAVFNVNVNVNVNDVARVHLRKGTFQCAIEEPDSDYTVISAAEEALVVRHRCQRGY